MITTLRTYLIMLGAMLVLLVMALGAGNLHGAAKVRAEWDAQKRADQAAAIAHDLQSTLVGQMVVDHYIDRVQVVLAEGAQIIKKVPVYVTQKADAACVVPVGFGRLHDAAVQGAAVPDAPGRSVDAPSGLALSTVADTVAGNYGICRLNAEKLTALQAWVKGQAAIK